MKTILYLVFKMKKNLKKLKKRKSLIRKILFLTLLVLIFLLISLLLSLLFFNQAKNHLLAQNFSSASKKAKISLNLLLPSSFLNLTPFKTCFQTIKTGNKIIILTETVADSSQKLFDVVVNNKPQDFEKSFLTWQKKLKILNKEVISLNTDIKFLSLKQKEEIEKVKQLLTYLADFSPYLAELLGSTEPKTYIVLLQNNFELRPSGGFMGSYAKLKFFRGVLTDLKVEDIYVPDGQIPGHVEPPWPIQQAFKQGWWKLRDANWDPDFPSASKDIQWFFEKGNEESADGLIALNLIVFKDLLKLVEPLNLPDYDFQINQDNFYQTAQNQTEQNFFPGSTQKKDFLSSVANQLIFKLKKINHNQSTQLLKILTKNLNQKQILISLNDEKLNTFLTRINWSGDIKKNYQDTKNLISDYIYIVDTNLGANKANCCIKRQAIQEISLEKNKLKDNININYINNSPKNRPEPPLFWGGVYENFLRVIIPQKAENIKVIIDGQELSKNKIEIKEYKDKNLKSLGFFVIAHPQSIAKVNISYEQKIQAEKPTQLFLEIQKQPGIESYEHKIKLIYQNQENQENQNIKTDSTIKFSL